MALTAILLAILALLLAYLYLKMKQNYSYWEKKGVAHPKPWPLLGNSYCPPRGASGMYLAKFYNQFPGERMFGLFQLLRPVLILRDPELIERVMVKDFGNFVDHGFEIDEESSPLEMSLFTMNGNKWRALRNKVTPIFTTGKLRGMAPLMAEAFRSAVDQIHETEEVDIRELFAAYGTIAIGSCVFGIDTKEISKPNSEFRQMNRKMFDMTSVQFFIRLTIILTIPSLAKKLGIGFQSKETLNYFEKIIVDTIDQRRKNPSLNRNDFIQTLLHLRDKGTVELFTKDPDDDYLHSEEHYSVETFEITDSMIVSQALSFLTMGYEGLSLAMMYCCLELAKNQTVQEKLRAEVNQKIEANHGNVDYETVKSMTYLDQCLKETLRLYPVAQGLMRVPTRPCELDGVHLGPGDQLFIPTMALHLDPAYFPDPEVFNPDRFAPDAYVTPFSYLPFGEGPRICIGFRFTMLEMKIGVALLVKTYRISLSPKTKLPLQYSAYNFFLTPTHKVLLQLDKLTA